MKFKLLNKPYSIVLLVLLACGALHAQDLSKLRDYLWHQDFQSLIDRFAQDSIMLVDKGDRAARIESLPYITTAGLRVQLFAGLNRENAEAIANRVRELQLDSVYVVQSDSLVKVQIGNFTERLEAEKMLDRLRFAGITTAWIVSSQIHVPKVSPVPTVDSGKSASQKANLGYTIQLFVTNDVQRAEQIRREAAEQTGLDVSIIHDDDFWKIMAGHFNDETTARAQLKHLQENGYPDAWLTQSQ